MDVYEYMSTGQSWAGLDRDDSVWAHPLLSVGEGQGGLAEEPGGTPWIR